MCILRRTDVRDGRPLWEGLIVCAEVDGDSCVGLVSGRPSVILLDVCARGEYGGVWTSAADGFAVLSSCARCGVSSGVVFP
jgi:hypothetical protein